MNVRTTLISVLLAFACACASNDESPAIPDCDQDPVTVSVLDVTEATSCSSADGAIAVSATGGKPPYTYTLRDVTSLSGMFDALASGVYTVKVTDDRGCAGEVPNIVVAATGFLFEANITADTDCVDGNGAVTIQITEGTPPFEFRFMDQAVTTVPEFASLESGEYDIEVTEASGCSAMLHITIPRGETGTSWSSEIQPILQLRCATTGCHNGLSRPDLRIYSNAKFYASQMKEFTQDGSMPFEGSMTQDEIDRIACWVDEGAKDN